MKIWTLNQREKNERYWWTEKKRSENSDTSIKVGYNILHYVLWRLFQKKYFFHSSNCLKRRFYAEIFKENFTQESYLQNQDSKSNEK